MTTKEVTARYISEMLKIMYELDEDIISRIVKLTGNISLDDKEHIQFAYSCTEQMIQYNIKLSEIEEMDITQLRECLDNRTLYYYTTAIACTVRPISLDDLLKIDYDCQTIYELEQDEFNKFVNFYPDIEDLPKVNVICGCSCVDNTSGECFGETFDTREKALKYLTTGLIPEEIEELFEEKETEMEI